MKLKTILPAVMLALCATVSAREARRVTVTLDSFLETVMRDNIALAAEKLNLPIADAMVSAAKVFNDPTIGVEYANNDDHRMQMGQSVSVELGYTLSPGKRGARVDLARSERLLAEALLTDFMRTLRLDAATAYFESVRLGSLYTVSADACSRLSEIARGDSARLAIGEIREVDAMQSRIQATIARGEMMSANTDYENSLLALNGFTGYTAASDTLLVPMTDAFIPARDYSLTDLVDNATLQRADLAAALKNVDVARKALTVERRERNIDIDLALGYNYNTEVRNEIAPAPRFSGVTVGVGIPLKFSNANRGTLAAANARVEQAEFQYREALSEVGRQVTEAFNSYETAKAMLTNFDTDVMARSAAILDSYLKGYRQGDVTLVELMEIEQSYNEVMTLYADTRFNHAVALLRLQTAAAVSE